MRLAGYLSPMPQHAPQYPAGQRARFQTGFP
jgi:hypothetical protein